MTRCQQFHPPRLCFCRLAAVLGERPDRLKGEPTEAADSADAAALVAARRPGRAVRSRTADAATTSWPLSDASPASVLTALAWLPADARVELRGDEDALVRVATVAGRVHGVMAARIEVGPVHVATDTA